ncbi:hypothetical protein O5623_00930 [Escherichia coli]|nr:hypothetical protein [Escherichia coli]
MQSCCHLQILTKDVYNKWGAANSYEGYKGKKTITAWIQQTEDDKQKVGLVHLI